MDSIRPGAVIDGRYELLAHLGSGGFGLVYKARQLTTGQLVAVKIARQFEEPTTKTGAVARFKREMSVVAELSHPNIVRLIDSGQLVDGRLFAVLQLVRGVSLSELLQKDGPLEPVEAKHLMMQVLDALCSAHDLGVIHRDLKPANIMVTAVSALRNALVLDFGIATFTKAMRDDNYQSLTPDGSVGGTPSYMAPEQLHGKEPNPQTDIYAWGLVFLECLTGQRVVRGSTVAENMFIHLRPDPHMLPPVVAVHSLGQVLSLALSKDPEHRYQDARAALAQLAPCNVADLPRLPRPEPTGKNDDPEFTTADPFAHTPPSATMAADPGPNTRWGDGRTTRTMFDTSSGRMPRRMSRSGATSSSQNVVAERRQLTALACEIGPMSQLSEVLGPDELYELMSQFRRLAETEIAALDGVIERHDGVRLISYFGFPVAHEDDASRAVQAAREICRRVREEKWAIPASLGTVDVYVGIHTGLVVASSANLGRSEDVSIVGDVSRVAVRLQETAEPGTVLLSDAVSKLVCERFDCEPAGVRDLGTLGPVPVYRVLHVADRHSMPAINALSVGRDSELAKLTERWEDVRDDDRGQVVLITGEAGIGKSHLTAAFQSQLVGEEHIWLDCASSPYLSGSAFHPIIHALENLFQFERNDSPGVKRRKLQSALAAYRTKLDIRAMGEFLTALLAIDEITANADAQPPGGMFRQPAEEQLLEFVFALAERCPVILRLEDLHWADPSTREFAQLLVDQTPLGAVFTLATTRPVYSPEWRTRSHVTPMPLARLPRRRVAAMVRAIGGSKRLPEELVAHLAEKTDGVPLFVEELTKAVLESSAVIERDDSYELAGDVSALAIPVSLRGSLMARLDRLGPAKEVAQIASIIGREFSFGLLESICEFPTADLTQALAQLVQAELAIQRGRPPNARYVFKHSLIQDTAYESLLEKTRRRYHERIAETLERHFGDIVQSQPELLAHHYSEAQNHEKAVDYWLRAGMRAIERSANVESIQHLRSGLALLVEQPESPERDKRELTMVTSLALSLTATKGYGATETEKAYSRALDLCRRIGDTYEHAPTLFGLWEFYQVRAEYDNASELGNQLLRLGESGEDIEIWVSAYQAVGCTLLLTGDYARAYSYLQKAIDFYDPNEHRYLAFIYVQDPYMFSQIFMSWVHMAQGNLEQARTSADNSIKWARELEHPITVAFALCVAFPVFEAWGDVERIRELARKAIEVCTEYRLPHWLAFANFMGGYVDANTGDLDGGIDKMQSALAAWQATGARTILTYFHSVLAEHLGRAGKIEQGLRLQSQVSPNNYDGRERYYEATWKRTMSRLLILRGSSDDQMRAEELLNATLTGARQLGDRRGEICALIDLIELRRQRNASTDSALARLGELVTNIREGHDAPMMRKALRVIGRATDT